MGCPIRILETGPVTLSGGFGNVALPNFVPVNNFCNTNAINGGLITPTTVSQNLSLAQNNLYYYSFTGIAGLNYQFSLCEERTNFSKILIYNNQKKELVSKPYYNSSCQDNSDNLNWFCNESNNYYVYVSDYRCNGLQQNATLSYIIPSKTLGLSINGIGRMTDNDSNPAYIALTISGFGLENVNGVFINTLNGRFYLNSQLGYYSSFSNTFILYLPSNTVLDNITLTGSFGTQVVNISALGVDEPSFETQK